MDIIEVTDIEAEVLESESISDRITQTRGEIEAYLSKTAVVHVTPPAPIISPPKKINSEDATVLPSSASETE